MFVRLFLLTIMFLPLQGLAQLSVTVESAKVEYIYNTPISHGSKIVVVSDSGRLIRSVVTDYTDSLPGGFEIFFPSQLPIASRVLTIQTMDSLFTVDLSSMTGSAQRVINLRFNDFGLQKRMSKVNTGVFLGKPCDIYEFSGAEFWIWKGILLKKEIEMDGQKFGEYAISLEEPYSLSREESLVPPFKRMK